jgi:hypothetical protein
MFECSRLTGRLFREPLLHFALVGAVLFGVSAARTPDAPLRDEIVVSAGEIGNLATIFTRTWQRPPTEAELDGLIAARLREEVLYREALALGLDAGDVVVRRRLVQKLEFLSDDLAARRDPSDAELQAWLDAHAETYASEARLSFRQVFLEPGRRGEDLAADGAAIRARLAAGTPPDTVGDPTLLPSALADEPRSRIARAFGERFADAIVRAETGRWLGPLESAYGAHIVRVDKVVPGGPATLDTARDAVLRDWRGQQRRTAQQALYEKLRARYRVTIAGPEDTAQ